MKAPWDRIKLRVLYWDGERPEAGDELLTRTGRRYLILAHTENQITALVLPKHEPVRGKVHGWAWGKRTKHSKR